MSPSTVANQGLATSVWKLKRQHSTIEVWGPLEYISGQGRAVGCKKGGQRPQQDSQDSSSAAIEDYLLPTHLEIPSFAPPAQLAPTIYPSEEGVTERGALGRKGQGPPMLSAAVRIHLDPHKNVKVRILLLPPAHLTWATASLVHTGAGRPPSSQLTDCISFPRSFW